MFASISGGTPVSGELVTWTFMYVNNIHSFLFITINYVDFYSNYISFLKMMDLREKLLPFQRLRAIQEELAGFLVREVLDPKGEHYVEDEKHYI
jgi:hypothetical protein